jgi:hypothetical protein
MVATVAFLAPVMAAVTPAISAFAVAMFVLGAAGALVGAGLMMGAMGLRIMVDVFSKANRSIVTGAGIIAEAALKVALPLLALGAVGLVASLGLAALGIAMVLAGAGALMLGTGLAMVSDQLGVMSQIIDYVWNNADKVIHMFATMAIGLFMLGGVAAIVAPGLLPLAAILIAVGLAAMGVGMGTKLFAEGMLKLSTISDGFIDIAYNVAESIGIIGGTVLGVIAVLIGLGYAATGAAPGLAAIGIAMLGIGAGVFLVAKGFQILQSLSESIVSTAWELAKAIGILSLSFIALAGAGMIMAGAGIGLAAVAITIGVLALAFNSLGNSFTKLGDGSKMFNDNISSAVTNVVALKEKLGDFKGIAKDFASEMSLLNTSFKELASSSGMGIDAIQRIQSIVSVEKSSSDSEQQNVVVERLDKISANTDLMVGLLTDIKVNTMNNGGGGGNFNSRVEVNTP